MFISKPIRLIHSFARMPCWFLREVFRPWQIFISIHMTWSARLPLDTRTRDFHLILYFFFVVALQQNNDKNILNRMSALFIFINCFFMREIFLVFSIYFYVFRWCGIKMRKKMQRMLDFIVQWVNKLISHWMRVISLCWVGYFSFSIFLFCVSNLFFSNFFSQSRARKMFGCAIVFKSNTFPFDYQKQIRYELQCN